MLALLLASVAPGALAQGLAVQISAARAGEGGLPKALGGGGLLPRARWRKTIHVGRLEQLTSPGGVRFEVRQDELRFTTPAGTRLSVDARGRFCTEGRVLTKPRLHGLALRFLDGSELRIRSGSGKKLRGASVLGPLDSRYEWVLIENGHPRLVRRRQRPFNGPVLYVLGDGSAVYELVSIAPWLFARPVLVQGRSKETRLFLLPGLLLDAGAELLASMPARSAQYPLARKQMRFIQSLNQRLFEDRKARVKVAEAGYRGNARDGMVLPIGQGVRLELIPGENRWQLVTRYKLTPDAPETLEFVVGFARSTLHRVLPEARQTRSRYQGRGIKLGALLEKSYPWKLPLAGPLQRKRVIDQLSAWNPRQKR